MALEGTLVIYASTPREIEAIQDELVRHAVDYFNSEPGSAERGVAATEPPTTQVFRDHEHCVEVGMCWQVREPCPAQGGITRGDNPVDPATGEFVTRDEADQEEVVHELEERIRELEGELRQARQKEYDPTIPFYVLTNGDYQDAIPPGQIATAHEITFASGKEPGVWSLSASYGGRFRQAEVPAGSQAELFLRTGEVARPGGRS